MQPRTSVEILLACSLATLALASPVGAADDPRKPPSAETEVERGERLWRQIDGQEPPPGLGLRSVFSYARALCETRRHPERLERLFALGVQAQDRDPKSRTYGNLKWYWRDTVVTDQNAVEFCVQDAAVIWLRHRDWLPAVARQTLQDWLVLACEGSLRHQVPSSYTNIALLNAGSLIVLGETFARTDVAEEGYRRLDGLCLWTWAFGISEYDSPTYYGVDLDGLRFLAAFAEKDRTRAQVAALGKLFWTDLALNWFPGSERLAGANSRSYDYLRGLGQIEQHLWRAGWFGPRDQEPSPLDRQKFPRLVRQQWGVKPSQSRTHWLARDVTLGSAAAAYGTQDLPLTIDLPGDRKSTRCYFIPDAREDPYGQKRYETGAAKHMKALHVQPFWAAAQRTRDVVGVAVYRPKDLEGQPGANLQSHLVLRRDVDGLWLRGQPIEVPRGTAENPGRLPIDPGDPLVLRAGTAAIGVRILWARTQDGSPAAAALVNDANSQGVLRLTVEHHHQPATVEAGVALWVRVGSGLNDSAAFDGWRRRFEAAAPTASEVSPQRLRFAVPGDDGPVCVEARSPFGSGGVQFDPRPTDAILELDGRDVGRPLLASIEPIHAREMDHPTRPIEVPAVGNVSWEAESGLVLSGMAIGEDGECSGGHFVWQPCEPAGSVATPDQPKRSARRPSGSVWWTIHAARPGRHYLWGRVLAPDEEHNSFLFSLIGDAGEVPPTAWSLRAQKGWHWEPLRLTGSKDSTPLELPSGATRLQLRVREPGTKIDRLLLTSDPRTRPE